MKLGHYNTLVWVTRFKDGNPIAGANVQVYVDAFGTFADNPEFMASAVTNSDGIATLPGTVTLDPDLKVLSNHRRSQPHLFVRVEKDEDMALIPLVNDFRVTTRGVNQTYVPSRQKRQYGHIHAWGFTAQGVYRVKPILSGNLKRLD